MSLAPPAGSGYRAIMMPLPGGEGDPAAGGEGGPRRDRSRAAEWALQATTIMIMMGCGPFKLRWPGSAPPAACQLAVDSRWQKLGQPGLFLGSAPNRIVFSGLAAS